MRAVGRSPRLGINPESEGERPCPKAVVPWHPQQKAKNVWFYFLPLLRGLFLLKLKQGEVAMGKKQESATVAHPWVSLRTQRSKESEGEAVLKNWAQEAPSPAPVLEQFLIIRLL